MGSAGRHQRDTYALFVLIIAAYFAVFSVYLKASPSQSATPTSSALKIWADPNPDRTFDQQLKIAFVPFILFIVLPLLAAIRMAVQIYEVCACHAVLRQWLVQPANWLRPPPLC